MSSSTNCFAPLSEEEEVVEFEETDLGYSHPAKPDVASKQLSQSKSS